MNGKGPVRIPKDVLEELEAVRLYTRTEALGIPLLRYVAMEREKPALVVAGGLVAVSSEERWEREAVYDGWWRRVLGG